MTRHRTPHPLAPHLIAIAVATFALGCSAPQASSGADTAAAATNRAAVEAATSAFHEALRTNDTTAFLSYLADDVVLMPPGEAALQGKEAVRGWYLAFLSHYRTSSLNLGSREVFVGDGWATELGTFEWGLAPVAGGDAVVDRGHYMQVWKQQPDGQWRFAREIWNSAAAPAGK